MNQVRHHRSQAVSSRQSAGANEMPQIFCGWSRAIPNSSGRSRLAKTTRAPADLLVSCTYTLIRAPSSSWPEVFNKAPCRFTTIVSPSQDNPVSSTSIRTRIGTRVLRRSSLRRSGFAIVMASSKTLSLEQVPVGQSCSDACQTFDVARVITSSKSAQAWPTVELVRKARSANSKY